MTFELAKELKDAGFLQPNPFGPYKGEMLQSPTYPAKELAYVPTLEELIEACGDESFILGRSKERGGQGGHLGQWTAHVHTSQVRTIGEGSTPDEAVARLWMALKKNGTIQTHE